MKNNNILFRNVCKIVNEKWESLHLHESLISCNILIIRSFRFKDNKLCYFRFTDGYEG